MNNGFNSFQKNDAHVEHYTQNAVDPGVILSATQVRTAASFGNPKFSTGCRKLGSSISSLGALKNTRSTFKGLWSVLPLSISSTYSLYLDNAACFISNSVLYVAMTGASGQRVLLYDFTSGLLPKATPTITQGGLTTLYNTCNFVYNNTLFCFSGTNSGRTVAYNDLYVFDTVTNTYSLVTTSGSGPSDVQAYLRRGVVIGDYFYVFNGLLLTYDYSNSRTLHRLNLQTYTWEAITTSFPTTVTGGPQAVFTVNGYLYVITSRALSTAGYATSNLYRYDTVANTWTLLGNPGNDWYKLHPIRSEAYGVPGGTQFMQVAWYARVWSDNSVQVGFGRYMYSLTSVLGLGRLDLTTGVTTYDQMNPVGAPIMDGLCFERNGLRYMISPGHGYLFSLDITKPFGIQAMSSFS